MVYFLQLFVFTSKSQLTLFRPPELKLSKRKVPMTGDGWEYASTRHPRTNTAVAAAKPQAFCFLNWEVNTKNVPKNANHVLRLKQFLENAILIS